jgi:hypothetical protein
MTSVYELKGEKIRRAQLKLESDGAADQAGHISAALP